MSETEPDVEVKLRNISKDKDRHGVFRHYYRVGKGPRIPLKGEPGSDEYLASYLAAKNGEAAPKKQKTVEIAPRSLRWLVTEYFGSAEFKQLDDGTQTVRRQVLEHCMAEPIEPGSSYVFGDCPLNRMSARMVRILRDRKLDLPNAGNARVKALRQVFKFGLKETDDKDVPLVDRNPARDVEYLLTNNPDGFHTWTLGEVKKFEDRHAIGTKARLALALLLYLAQRRSDIVQFGRQHVQITADPDEGEFERTIVFTQFKGRRRKPVTLEIPIVPQLWEIIEQSPTGDLTFLVTEFKRGFTAAGFGNWFRDRCNEAGLKHCSAHGLRKASASRLAELGCTDRQIMAITGHRTEKEVTRYTRGARQKVMAKEAMKRLAQNAK